MQLLKQFPNMVVEPEKLSSTKFRVRIVLASPSWNISVCSFPAQPWYQPFLPGTSLSAHSLPSPGTSLSQLGHIVCSFPAQPWYQPLLTGTSRLLIPCSALVLTIPLTCPLSVWLSDQDPFLPTEMSERLWTAYSAGTPLSVIPQHWCHEVMLELAFQERHGLDFEMLCPGNLLSGQHSSALQSCQDPYQSCMNRFSPLFHGNLYFQEIL